VNLYQFALSVLMAGVALLPLAILAWISRSEFSEPESEYDYR
jgi:hypothetical protein